MPGDRSPKVPIDATCPAVGPIMAMVSLVFERKNAAFILQQHCRVFCGLFNDGSVGVGVLRRDLVLLLAVEISKAIDLIEHAPRGCGDRRFGDRAIFESVAHRL